MNVAAFKVTGIPSNVSSKVCWQNTEMAACGLYSVCLATCSHIVLVYSAVVKRVPWYFPSVQCR